MSGGPQGEGVPPRRGPLQVVGGGGGGGGGGGLEGEPRVWCGHTLEPREAEVPADVGEREASLLQGRLGRGEDGLLPGFGSVGRLAVAAQQVPDEERRVLGGGGGGGGGDARLRRGGRLGHVFGRTCGCGLCSKLPHTKKACSRNASAFK